MTFATESVDPTTLTTYIMFLFALYSSVSSWSASGAKESGSDQGHVSNNNIIVTGFSCMDYIWMFHLIRYKRVCHI